VPGYFAVGVRSIRLADDQQVGQPAFALDGVGGRALADAPVNGKRRGFGGDVEGFPGGFTCGAKIRLVGLALAAAVRGAIDPRWLVRAQREQADQRGVERSGQRHGMTEPGLH
jgi:hypothetical protein